MGKDGPDNLDGADGGKPSQIGIFRDQEDDLKRLRSRRIPSSVVLYTACERYRNGELKLVQNDGLRKKSDFVLVYLPVRKRPPYPDAMIRRILDAHRRTPVDVGAEIARLDAEIEAMFPKGEYILETE